MNVGRHLGRGEEQLRIIFLAHAQMLCRVLNIFPSRAHGRISRQALFRQHERSGSSVWRIADSEKFSEEAVHRGTETEAAPIHVHKIQKDRKCKEVR